jgi:ABC-type spermidine/putrescine transport system permease subunit I
VDSDAKSVTLQRVERRLGWGVVAPALAWTVALVVLPFWTTYVVRSCSGLLVLGKNGVVNRALVGLGLIAEPLELAPTRTATVIGFVHFFVMLLTLTI